MLAQLPGELLALTATVLLLLLGFVTGKLVEAAHFRSLRRREAAHADLAVNNLKRPPAEHPPVREAFLCTGSVVIGSDYYKRFGAILKSLLGGRLRTLETLLERARREATLRMVERARRRGAHMVINTRYETTTIGFGRSNRGLASAEVIAYGTGLVFDRAARP